MSGQWEVTSVVHQYFQAIPGSVLRKPFSIKPFGRRRDFRATFKDNTTKAVFSAKSLAKKNFEDELAMAKKEYGKENRAKAEPSGV